MLDQYVVIFSINTDIYYLNILRNKFSINEDDVYLHISSLISIMFALTDDYMKISLIRIYNIP